MAWVAVVVSAFVAACEPEFRDIYCSDPKEATRAECVGRVPARGGSGGQGAALAGAAGAAGATISGSGNGGASGTAAASGGGGAAGLSGGAAGNGGAASGAGSPGGATSGGQSGASGAASGAGGVTGGGGLGAAAGTSGAAGAGGSAGSGGVGGGCSLGAACNAIAEVGLGAAHACVRRGDGAVLCWGENGRGQLGRGVASVGVIAVPAQVEGLAADRLSCGGDTSCVVTPQEGVRCWGDDAFGQLGRDAEISGDARAKPGAVVQLAAVRSVTVGAAAACAIESTGSIRCWGDNRTALLGAAPTLSRKPVLSKLVAEAVSVPDPVGIGAARACARGKFHQVNCVGGNRYAEGGTDTATDDQYIGGLDSIDEVAVGAFFACGRATDSGKVFCWGRGDEGQLGGGTASASVSDQAGKAVPNLVGTSSIAAGAAHVCAVISGGKVTCWGDCSRGACGNGQPVGTTPAVPTPVTVPDLDNVKKVFAGHHATCALLDGGVLKCWGEVAGASPTSVPTTVALP